MGLFVAVTGVSGAGKSTLINQVLYPSLAKKLHKSDLFVGKHKEIRGIDQIDKVINIDQKPIGRTPRSNPATYTKLFDLIRDFYAMLPESKVRGYKKGRFSFNVKGGRCEHCQGDGFIKVEMHFLADVFVPCEVCNGKRFNQATCEILYKGHSIADILELSVAEARELFTNHPGIVTILNTLIDVGLGYIKLGQSATTLSGERPKESSSPVNWQREIQEKLSTFSTSLRRDFISKTSLQLLEVLQRLCDNGNTILVIEHNLDVIKCADWIIDMGPEGGAKGGVVVAKGTPEKVSNLKKSVTGKFIKEALES